VTCLASIFRFKEKLISTRLHGDVPQLPLWEPQILQRFCSYNRLPRIWEAGSDRRMGRLCNMYRTNTFRMIRTKKAEMGWVPKTHGRETKFMYTSVRKTWRAVPQLRRLVAGFPPRRPGFQPRSGHVGFLVDKVELRQVFSDYFGFPCQFSFHQHLRVSSRAVQWDK
jgi:hypothetical protein